jgi:large subunit ribosomal protein L10
MKSPREIKQTKINMFKQLVETTKAMVVTDYKGLTVHEMEDLRIKLRASGGQLAVIKNTLARVALNEMGIDVLDKDLIGQVAFVFSHEDAVSGTKIITDFIKGKENIKLIAGFFDGKRLSIDDVKALANMPSKKELQSQFVGVLLAPLQDFVGTLEAPLVEFIGTLDAYVEKLGGAVEEPVVEETTAEAPVEAVVVDTAPAE